MTATMKALIASKQRVARTVPQLQDGGGGTEAGRDGGGGFLQQRSDPVVMQVFAQ